MAKLFRNVMFWIVLVAIGALLAQLLLRDPGYLLVRYGGMEYEMTVASAVIGLLLGLLALWLLVTLVTLPFRAWRGRRDRLSRARLGEGLDALHQGHHARAEKLLVQAADDDDVAGVARSGAAQAALGRGDAAAASAHLDAIGDRHAAVRAIGRAELALANDRPTDALVALDAPDAQPLPPAGLALRAQALAASGQSAQAYGLLGALRQQQALPDARLSELESRLAEASLRETVDGNALAERWDALSSSAKTEPRVAMAYADQAAAMGWDDAALRALENSLDARWDERVAAHYGRLPIGRLDARRTVAERWLVKQPSSAALLLTLSRLLRQQGETRQADDYLQRALALGAGGDAWEEQGDACAANGDDTGARIAYANALRVARGEAVVDPGVTPLLPAPVSAPSEYQSVETDDIGAAPLPSRGEDPSPPRRVD